MASNRQISTMQLVFKQARKKPTTLYKAIQGAWKCSCQEHQFATLRLEHRTGAEKMSFQMIMNSTAP